MQTLRLIFCTYYDVVNVLCSSMEVHMDVSKNEFGMTIMVVVLFM